MALLTITAADVGIVSLPHNTELVSGFSAEAIDAGVYVRYNTSSGKIEKGNGSTTAEARKGGVCTKGSNAAGEPVEFVRKGIVSLGNALSALTYDDDVHLSDTDGRLADTTGSQTRIVGTVIPNTIDQTPDKVLRIDL